MFACILLCTCPRAQPQHAHDAPLVTPAFGCDSSTRKPCYQDARLRFLVCRISVLSACQGPVHCMCCLNRSTHVVSGAVSGGPQQTDVAYVLYCRCKRQAELSHVCSDAWISSNECPTAAIKNDDGHGGCFPHGNDIDHVR